MVLREVGEHRDVGCACRRGAARRCRSTTPRSRTPATPASTKRRNCVCSATGIGRRQAREVARRARPAGAERADDAAATAERVKRLREPPGGRRLAVGAGDGDARRSRSARRAEEAAAIGPVARLQLRVARRCASRSKPKASHALGLDEARDGARRERRGTIAAPVGGGAGPGDEARRPARRWRLSRAARRVTRACSQPRGFGGAGEFAASEASPPRPACRPTICGLTFRSGCTPSMRSVCCTDRAEHRRGDVAAEVLARARLVDHHRDDDARVARSARCRRTRRGTCWSRSPCLPACRRCRSCRRPSSPASAPSAPCRRARPPSAASCARRPRSSARTPARRRRGLGRLLSSVAGMICAVVREHGVGARDLEQRRRQAVAVATSSPARSASSVLYGRRRPLTAPGKADLRLLAEADLR